MVDFPGVDDEDDSIGDLADLLITVAQIILFVVDYRYMCVEQECLITFFISTLTVVNVSRNGRGALYKPLKLFTLKTRKIHLNRPFKVIHSLHLVTLLQTCHKCSSNPQKQSRATIE